MNSKFEDIKNKLNNNEQLALVSMLNGDNIVETGRGLAVSTQTAQKLRMKVYEVMSEFVEFGETKKGKQQKLIEYFEKLDKEDFEQFKQERSVLLDEYFNGLDLTAIAELAKKSIRMTAENSELIGKIEELSEDLKNSKMIIEENKSRVKELEEKVQETKTVEPDLGNFLVFNPKHGSPNKIYKDYTSALEDAKRVAKLENDAVFVLKLQTSITPDISYLVDDLSEKVTQKNYIRELVV